MLGSPERRTPDWLLPALLKPAEKRVLDLLHDWPGISPDQARRAARGLTGRVSMRSWPPCSRPDWSGRIAIEGRRLALTDRGLALLARRDRTPPWARPGSGGASFPAMPALPLTWRNVSGRRTRQLLRNLDHTAAVHRLHIGAGQAGTLTGLGCGSSSIRPSGPPATSASPAGCAP